MKRVLIVDDDPAFRRLLPRVLLRIGFDSVAVESVPEALRTLGETQIDVILLDVQLKGHTGHSLLRGLDRAQLDLPVVMMSGVGTMQDVVQALRHNAADWLTKPFEPEELWEALSRALDARRGSRSGGGRSGRRTGEKARLSGPASTGSARTPSSAGLTRLPEAPPEPELPVVEPAQGVGPESVGTRDPEEVARLGPGDLVRALSRLGEQIQDGTVQLPPLDPVALELQELFDSPAPGIGDVLAVVERDPAVAAAMLRLANSIRFQGEVAAATLKAACIRLGNRRVLTIAQEVMVKELFSGQGEFGEVATAMWENVLVTSQGARLLAERLSGLDPDEVHLAALFHNMGELVLLRVLRTLTEGKQVSGDDLALFTAEVEKRHEEVGALLLKTWGISLDFIRLAGGHHRVPLAPETSEIRLLRRVVFAAWQMALYSGFTYLPGQEASDPQALIEELGLEWDEAEDLFARSKDWLG